MSAFADLLNDFSKYLKSNELLESARCKAKDFTRQRTLTFPVVMTFLLSGLQSAVQSELDRFFAHLDNRADSKRKGTAQAFSKARYKIRQQVFVWVNQPWVVI